MYAPTLFITAIAISLIIIFKVIYEEYKYTKEVSKYIKEVGKYIDESQEYINRTDTSLFPKNDIFKIFTDYKIQYDDLAPLNLYYKKTRGTRY